MPAVGCLGWLLGLGAWWFAWVGLLESRLLRIGQGLLLGHGSEIEGSV